VIINLKLDNFEGPLDLLVHLIDKKKLSIQDIRISQLIDEYLEVIERAKEADINIKVEFLTVACELLEIKALSIINTREMEKKEEELSRKIQEYKVYKSLLGQIEAMENEYNIPFKKNKNNKIVKLINNEVDLSKLEIQNIFNSYSKFIKSSDEALEIDFEKKYDLKEEMNNISYIASEREVEIELFFEKATDRLHLVYLFLAILELYRENRVEIIGNRIKSLTL